MSDKANNALGVEVIKQYPGEVTARRRVIVKAPGKFFNGLVGAEQ